MAVKNLQCAQKYKINEIQHNILKKTKIQSPKNK